MSWDHQVIAVNTATESTNKMHDDEVAASYGFAGGLVPGVDVWAYMTRPCVDRWGVDFLERGTMEARFVEPVYDGEAVTVTLDDVGSLTAVGPDGVTRAVGSAAVDDDASKMPEAVHLEAANPPSPVPDATPERLAPGTVLAKLRYKHQPEAAARYLELIGETNPLYQDGMIGHPGAFARQANYVLSSSVKLGPWIHVATRAWHRGVVHAGEQVETRAIVVDEREHKGHRFVDLEVEITANESPVWSGFHTAIWQPRRQRRS